MSDTDDQRTPGDRPEAAATPTGARRTVAAEHRAETKRDSKSTGATVRSTLRNVTDLLARVVMGVATVIAFILALHILFVVFQANPANAIVRTIDGWALDLSFGLRDLFLPDDERVRVLVNFGIAAVVYLVVGRILAGLIRRIG
ncbi:MAG: hypothetical protein GEV11_01085 [Streptosporangiales bacterium]|nr:hypothetical protein [Streptosporangiales bacterium]